MAKPAEKVDVENSSCGVSGEHLRRAQKIQVQKSDISNTQSCESFESEGGELSDSNGPEGDAFTNGTKESFSGEVYSASTGQYHLNGKKGWDEPHHDHSDTPATTIKAGALSQGDKLDSSNDAERKRKAEEQLGELAKKAKNADGDAVPSKGGSTTKTVFVGCLSWNVDDSWLAGEFAECGEVVSACVRMDRNTGRSRGFGYVKFAATESVQAALNLSGKEIDGRKINVDKSDGREQSVARQSRAQKFGDTPNEPSMVLFVANLSWSTTKSDIWDAFDTSGEVKDVRLPTYPDTGKHRGFGYVEFMTVEAATKAYDRLLGTQIDGRLIRLDYSRSKVNNRGSRLTRGGGGRGGPGHSHNRLRDAHSGLSLPNV